MHIAGFFRANALTFVEKKHESGDIYTFYFSSKKPIKHIAGQHGLFILPKLKGVHIFSLSSSPEEEYIAISTHVRKESSYKQQLNSLAPGDHVLMCGPVLDFIFRNNENRYIFLAQGIGITPFRSLLVHANRAKLRVKTTLIHVDGTEHTFHDETTELASQSFYPTNPEGFTELVSKTLDTEALYYLSGSPRFVKATKRTLANLGVKHARIISDNFLGY